MINLIELFKLRKEKANEIQLEIDQVNQYSWLIFSNLIKN